MKILYVYGMAKTRDIVVALRKMGYTVEEYGKIQSNSILDDKEIKELVNYISKRKITHIMSIHLIYNLAVAAYRTDIKYISVIWDAPYLKPYTVMGKLDNVWYSVFDKLDCERLKNSGFKHVLYQPLAVNRDNILKWNSKAKLNGQYISDISFVANLYGNNLYDKQLQALPENMQNYFISIFEEAAFHWDGVNRIYGKTSKEVLEYIKLVTPGLKFENPFDVEDVRYFEVAYLVRKLANIERICILNMLAQHHKVYLYTDSIEAKEVLDGVSIGKPVLAGEPVSAIYAGSKINLNISLKGIEGGTPQRIMDIMGAGGFVLTNYCSETAELFEENKEIVMFKTPEELLEKVDYYLSHDEEREEIAEAGHKKVLQRYTYEHKMKQLMGWVENDEKD